MANEALKRDKAYLRLRALRPAKLSALVDGDPRPLALASGRGRWERCLNSARAMGAEAIECQDEDDAVIEILILDAKKHAGRTALVEDLDDEETSSKVGEVRALIALCLDAADRSVGRQESHVGQVLDAAIQVMKAAADRAERNERAMDKLLRAHARLLMRETASEDDGMGTTADMLAMMSAILHGNPDALRQMQGAGAGGGGNGFGGAPGEQMVSVPKSLVDKAVASMQRQAAEDAAAAAATDAEVVDDDGGDPE